MTATMTKPRAARSRTIQKIGCPRWVVFIAVPDPSGEVGCRTTETARTDPLLRQWARLDDSPDVPSCLNVGVPRGRDQIYLTLPTHRRLRRALGIRESVPARASGFWRRYSPRDRQNPP